RVVNVEALEVGSYVVGDGIEAALLELRLDLVRVPRLDPPREIGDPRHPGSATPTSASAAPAAGVTHGWSRRGRGRHEPVRHDRSAHVVADVHHGLLAIVAPHLPSHEG